MSENIIPAIVATSATAVQQIEQFKSGSAIFSTLNVESFAGKKALLAAKTNAVPLAEVIEKDVDKVIALENFILEAVTIADEQTGELSDVLRSTLIDSDGTAYVATSVGIRNSLQDLMNILGHPSTWGEALPIRVVEKRGKSNYRFMTIVMA